MKTLPPYLETLLLQFNKIRGTITLTELPQNMEHLMLFNNPLDKIVVLNEFLPESLCEVRAWNSTALPINVIVDSIDGKKPDHRILIKKSIREKAYIKKFEGL